MNDRSGGFLKIFLKLLQLPSQITKSVRYLFILLTYNRTVYVLFCIPSYVFKQNIPQSSLKRTKFMWSIGNIRFSEISFILILLKSYIFTPKYNKPISIIHTASKNHFSVTTLQFEQKPWDIRYYMLLEMKIYSILVKIKLS